MNPENSKLRHEQRSEEEQIEVHNQQARHDQQSQTEPKEFASVDDLLRYDSSQNPLPNEIGERLNKSLAAEPVSDRPWYKKIFGT